MLISIVVTLSCTSVVSAQDDDKIIAQVGNTPVTLREINEAWHSQDPSSRIRMLQQFYDTQRRVLDIVIGEHLIEREAAKRGISPDELLAAELPSRTQVVTDAEVDQIYERNRDRLGGNTLEEMQPEIRQMLEQQRPTKALHQYMSELRAAATDVFVLLDPPRQEITALKLDPVRGPDDAVVEIVEFSDFQCPFCLRAFETLTTLRNRYGSQIRFVYKDYPLPSHAEAFKAAEAGNCANEQGRFWEFHDKLFEIQSTLDVMALKEYAGELGLDETAFASCLDSGRFAGEVQRDIAIGQSYGVSATPAFFINGRAVMGAVRLDVFDQIVREEIAAAER